MKFGFRTPSPMTAIKARTTGKLKRKLKKLVNPLYGKKGMGLLTNPKKSLYNAVYSRTTVGLSDVAKAVTTPLKTTKKATTKPTKAKSLAKPIEKATALATTVPACPMCSTPGHATLCKTCSDQAKLIISGLWETEKQILVVKDLEVLYVIMERHTNNLNDLMEYRNNGFPVSEANVKNITDIMEMAEDKERELQRT